jgi:cytochrome c556
MLQRALRLRAPKVLVGHLDGPESVLLDACGRHVSSGRHSPPKFANPNPDLYLLSLCGPFPKGSLEMKKMLTAALVLALAGSAAYAQVKPEDQLKLRKAAYALMNFNYASLAAMAQDKKPYNKDEAIRNADFVAMLATVPQHFFGDGTDKVGETRAKPEIWTNRADFNSKMDKMIAETGKLPQVARTGDLAALKKQMGDTGAACKACHDEYRTK